MVDNSLVPKAWGITDAARAREEQARLAERRDGARRAAATTVSSEGKLDVDGGNMTIFNGGNVVVKDSGSFRVEDGGSMDIYDGGVVRVNGQAVNQEFGDIYKVTAELTTLQKLGYVEYKSPGIKFSSEVVGSKSASIYSQMGIDISMDAGQGSFALSTSSARMSSAEQDGSYYYNMQANEYGGIRSKDVINDIEWGIQLTNIEVISGNYERLPGGEFIAGHTGLGRSFSPDYFSRLRTQHGGKIWLESKGSGTSSIAFLGNGDIEIQGNVTVNGAPIGSGGTPAVTPVLIFRRNAALTLTSGYLGNLPWDAVGEDAALYPTDKGRMYVDTAGLYSFSCFITISDPNKSGNRQVVVKKNGTNYTGIAAPSNSANFAGSFSTPIRLAAGDYLEIVAYQNSGANATIIASSGGNSYNNASLQWLRP